jgi:hypothetical protein
MIYRPTIGFEVAARAQPAVLAVLLLTSISGLAQPTAGDFEFFEKNIRPVLVERCFKCHSAQSEKLKGGLHLDSREGMLKGGDTRPALIPRDPEQSLMIEAIRYRNSDLQMPPKGKLTDKQIADFTAWVKMGAPWPPSSESKQSSNPASFDLEKRRREHWAWQPILPPRPPSVKDEARIHNSIDRFILSRLESNQLKPAPRADKATLLRRLYFDLTGLPPTSHQLEEFLKDSSPRSFEKVVDTLLASPHFGERWARHWLDLVRYAETLGHEFDYSVHNAWRYRDYVIRALNADVPYDQFVTEHIAGDLLPVPRRHPTEGSNESIIATGFFWLGQRDHSPVDVRQHQAELIDNQIDVMTKTFLGLTVSCARCHDHKFDAIATRDFYSLYGVLESSRYAQRAIDPPARVQSKIERLRELKKEIRHVAGALWATESSNSSQYLLATSEVTYGDTNATAQVAAKFGLNPKRLGSWINALGKPQEAQPTHPFFAWTKLAKLSQASPPEFAEQWQAVLQESKAITPAQPAAGGNYEIFTDFSDLHYKGWFVDGEAFGFAASARGEMIVGGTNKPLSLLAEPAAHSAVTSRRLQGALRSPTFEIRHRYIHLLAAGRDSRINLFIDNLTMIQDPIYGGLRKQLNHDAPKWVTIDVTMWQGHRAYLEFSDITTPDPTQEAKKIDPSGYAAVSRIVLSDQSSAASLAQRPSAFLLLGDNPIDSRRALAENYQRVITEATATWASGHSGKTNYQAQIELLDWMLQRELLTSGSPGQAESPGPELSALLDEFRKVELSIPEPMRVPAMADGSGIDEYIFIRGNHKNRGETAPRRFLTAIGDPSQSNFKQGSGRLELAHCMTDSSNPFLSRVMVNRVWQHLFGRGIVPTPDDFGVLGQPPSHPELLDWLADWYRSEGDWSTKKLIRLLVTSSTYQMSSSPSDAANEEKDPNNIWLHRMPVRRLEGEAIRDAMLAVSGRLGNTMFGPSIPAHLTEFMEGRGRPGRSGPLDGAGRRSIYLEVRRNFIAPMMRSFDTPVPFTTVGQRTVSNVPAQSLILMNDPFVIGQAQIWARRILASPHPAPEQSIADIYLAAFSRLPSSTELTEALAFLNTQGENYGLAPPERLKDERVWSDLCHVMLNLKEFIFLN